MTANRTILLGGGGHGLVVAALAAACGRPPTALVDPDQGRARLFTGAVWLGGADEAVFEFQPREISLLNGVGANGPAGVRRRLYERMRELGYSFPALAHPFSWLSPSVEVADGAQIMAGAVIQPGVWVGRNAIINTGASVDHECVIGAHVHISPGATLCGRVTVGEGAMVGAGAVVLPGVTIGASAMVAAGATVTKDVPDGACVGGTPARALRLP